jgi:hypothetical protein
MAAMQRSGLESSGVADVVVGLVEPLMLEQWLGGMCPRAPLLLSGELGDRVSDWTMADPRRCTNGRENRGTSNETGNEVPYSI